MKMARKKIIFWSLTDSDKSIKYDFEEGLGPYKLAAIAKSKGYESKVFQASQFGCDEAKIEKMTLSEIDGDCIIAISAFSTSYSLLESLLGYGAFLDHPILIGGPGATTTPFEFLQLYGGRNPIALVQGDGEELFGKMLDLGPYKWHKADGVWTYDIEGKLIEGTFQMLVDMDLSPFPDLSASYQRENALKSSQDGSLPLDERIKALRSLSFSYIETRRGCFNRCEFCSEPQLARKGVRRMTPERAVDEMVHLYSNYGITFFSFADNIAFDIKEWWNSFAEHLKDSGISPYITFGGYGTPKFFAREDWFDGTFQSLIGVGLSFVTLGVQSGSERVLRDIIKRPHDDPENALSFVQSAIPYGLNVKTDFIVGHPTETMQDLRDTHESVRNIYEAGGQVFVRRLGVVPNSGYDLKLHEGAYELPKGTKDYRSLSNKVLAYHGKRDSFNDHIRERGIMPRFNLIDTELGIHFPRNSMSREELTWNQQMLNNSGMPDLLKERYSCLFELFLQRREAEPTQYQQP